MKLLVFIRQGCCICDSLKKKIKKTLIENDFPNLEVEEIDIDRFDLYQEKFKK